MRKLTLAVALLVAGCRNDAPAGPTAQQSDQLNEAEHLLNEVAVNDAHSTNVR